MMRKTICLIAVLLSAVMLYAQKQAKALVEELNNPKSKKVLVVSHRGDWRNAPENSLQAKVLH